jgi:hypothetical protein
MKEDDRYDPAAANDSQSIDSRAERDALEALRAADPRFAREIRWIPNPTEKNPDGRKKVVINYHGSGDVGSKIRNAVTGERYSITVGHRDQDLLFSVCNSRGLSGRNEPLFLFYDTPEQYESHVHTILEQPIKEAWYSRNLATRERLGL